MLAGRREIEAAPRPPGQAWGNPGSPGMLDTAPGPGVSTGAETRKAEGGAGSMQGTESGAGRGLSPPSAGAFSEHDRRGRIPLCAWQ